MEYPAEMTFHKPSYCKGDITNGRLHGEVFDFYAPVAAGLTETHKLKKSLTGGAECCFNCSSGFNAVS